MTLKIKERDKNEAAVKSFQGTSFLIDEEKIMISKWIHPNKVFIYDFLELLILILMKAIVLIL